MGKKTQACRRRPFTDEAPLIGKIHPFRKIAVTFEPEQQCGCPSGFRISLKKKAKAISVKNLELNLKNKLKETAKTR